MEAKEAIGQVNLPIGEGFKSESVKSYLEKKVYPILQTALLDVKLICTRQLLTHAESTGELQKYWKQFEATDDRARDETKKIERERKKLEMGSDYESEGEDYDEEGEESGEPEEASQVLSVRKGQSVLAYQEAAEKPGQMGEITEKAKEEEEV